MQLKSREAAQARAKQQKVDTFDKENSCDRLNQQQRDKKFCYCANDVSTMHRHKNRSRNHQGHADADQQAEIQILKQQLQEERQKVKYLQSRTIKEQCTVLQSLETLESKFQELSYEKQDLLLQLQQIKSRNGMQNNDMVNWKQKYEELESQHKKVKNIAQSLVNMMKKVDGVEGNIKDAWQWVKKVVWEYESIRKKAMEWKQVYDQVTEAVSIIDDRPYHRA